MAQPGKPDFAANAPAECAKRLTQDVGGKALPLRAFHILSYPKKLLLLLLLLPAL